MDIITLDDLNNIKNKMCEITINKRDTIKDMGIDIENIIDELKNIEEINYGDTYMINGEEIYIDDDGIPVIKSNYDYSYMLDEIGAAVCIENNKLVLKNIEESCSAASCSIDYTGCDAVGSFHTHPLNDIIPSIADFLYFNSEKHKLLCVGSKIKDKPSVLCLTIEDQEELTKKIMQSAFSSDIRNKNYSAIYGRVDIEPDARVNFYRETPIPSPSEILRDVDDYEIERYYHEDDDYETLDEFKYRFMDQLKSGEIPEEYYDNYEYDGSEDYLNIYLHEKQLEKYKTIIRNFDEVLNVFEFDCEDAKKRFGL